MRQRRSTNQHQTWVTAAEACAFLVIKQSTLYAYVSRGFVRSVAATKGRQRQYLKSDLERLKSRQDVRKGNAPAAAGALRFGEPVLPSAITDIRDDGPSYRGQSAVALARSGASFESVSELIWTGVAVAPNARWSVRRDSAESKAILNTVKRVGPVEAMAITVPQLAARDPDRYATALDVELPRARRIVHALAAAVAAARGGPSLEKSVRAGSVAEALLFGSGGERGAAAVDEALILCADHELNVSSFAARVAASSGADLYACVQAALAAFSGPAHGGASELVESFVDDIADPRKVVEFVRDRGARGESFPGFGHLLYPAGDPRATRLLELAAAIDPVASGVVTRLAEVVRARRGERANLDLALVALRRALRLPRGSATAIFAVGRSAGWIAHAFEQRAAGWLIRPRAHYSGPGATPAEAVT